MQDLRKWCAGLLLALIPITAALATSFDIAPHRFAEPVNRNLTRAGSGIHIELTGCRSKNPSTCSFESSRVGIIVQGSTNQRRIARITIVADLMQDREDDPQATLEEAMLVFGAIILVFDPHVLGSRRTELLSKLVENALNVGRAEGDGFDGRYMLLFDSAADGRLLIKIAPKPIR
jgi:hypothetical protein